MSDTHLAHEAHDHPPYMRIFGILLALTAIELACVFIDEEAVAIPILLIIAVWKIWLIGRYFMHLRFDGAIIGVISCIPLVLASILALGLLLERM